MSRLLRITSRNFDDEVIRCERPVLVEFSGSWCVPSQQQKTLLERLAEECDGEYKVGNINVDQNPKVASKYYIMGCPTLILFNEGQVIQRRVGAQSMKQLKEMLQIVVTADPE
jgi:thioredoxin 1